MTLLRRGTAYCRGACKRAFDASGALIALVILTPILLVLAVVNLTAAGRPILFVQERAGLDGRPFRLIKFRTMRAGEPGGLPVTGRGDRRITPLGRFLRATKLDELPQLVNILRGDMSFVGPRPEVPRYVAKYTPEQRRILAVRPGLTDPATLRYRNEEVLLGSVDESLREELYEKTVLPEKLRMNLDYVERAGFLFDIGLIVRTLASLLGLYRG